MMIMFLYGYVVGALSTASILGVIVWAKWPTK